ncbi:hypothetical protein [Flavilitoribacter nigricans]|uniref:hypothetical protein n=1 Tax=Flavilitoribacter nigricans TaxID=70997 RepID=UPI000C04DA68|nr:hypothetical protein [Flavilitoribacter nigricans]
MIRKIIFLSLICCLGITFSLQAQQATKPSHCAKMHKMQTSATLESPIVTTVAVPVSDRGALSASPASATPVSGKAVNCSPKDCDPSQCDPAKCPPKSCDPSECETKTAGQSDAKASLVSKPATCQPSQCQKMKAGI